MSKFGRCLSCNVPLLEPGGFYQTDLCGPCCTGESRTAGCLTEDDPIQNDPPEETDP